MSRNMKGLNMFLYSGAYFSNILYVELCHGQVISIDDCVKSLPIDAISSAIEIN